MKNWKEKIAAAEIHPEDLLPNEIFVFGSNESGMHSGGAARVAMGMGAIWGQGVGLQGSTYAIPTISENFKGTLKVEQIKKYVDDFVEFAKQNSQYTFLVTEIGCGIAGHIHADIAPLFIPAMDMDNVHLPEKFWVEIVEQ